MNSTESFGSATENNESIPAALIRNSIDNQAINELRNFIQNSDKKSQGYCSI